MLRPFRVAGERVAEPFGDAYGWFESLFGARSEAERCRRRTRRCARRRSRHSSLSRRTRGCARCSAFRDGPRFPQDYHGVAAAVIGRPAAAFSQAIVIAVGSNHGVRRLPGRHRARSDRPRDSRLGLVPGHAAHRRAERGLRRRHATNATGVVRHGRASGSTLVLDRVSKEDDVRTATSSSRRAGSRPGSSRSIPVASRSGGHERRADRHRSVQAGAGRAVRGLPLARRGRRARPEAARRERRAADRDRRLRGVDLPGLRRLRWTCWAARPTCCSWRSSASGSLRGATVGAVSGFAAGLIVDTATLGTLGVTSLLLTLAGYWAGRYGETTGRGRPFAPYIAVVVIAVSSASAGTWCTSCSARRSPCASRSPPVLPSAALDAAARLARVPALPLGRRDRSRERAPAGGGARCLARRTASGARRRAASSHPTRVSRARTG